VDDTSTWNLIHGERAAIADTLSTLAPDQWATPSLCGGWTVQMAAGHIVMSGEQTPGLFMKGMLSHGFRFNTMMDRQARAAGAQPTATIIERIRARTTTTNKPPGPAQTMLGEVLVHSEDIRRPLGLAHTPDPAALVACLDMYKKANFPVGAKKRIAGLRLQATDLDWTYGDGPEVAGPALSLLMMVTGRAAGLDGLSGEGVPTLQGRMAG
jgi:uncharacterized protein (TIGR03083 family)